MIRNRKLEKGYTRLERFQSSMSVYQYIISEDGLLTLSEHKLNKNYQGKSRLSKMLEEMRKYGDSLDDLDDES